MLSDDEVREYLERLVPLQEAFTEDANRLNEIKREAQSDGLSIDALNAFLPILVKYPHDKGARVLKEVIRCAETLGAEPLTTAGDTRPTTPSNPSSDTHVSPPTVSVPSAAVSGWRARADAPLRLTTQVVAAVIVTFGLIWLLN